MTLKLRALPLLVAVVLALSAIAARAEAATTVPCWKQVINDWFDGEITGTYNPSCYSDAIKKLPTDVSLYSDAESAIRAALLTALRAGPTPDVAVATANAGTVGRRALADMSTGSAATTGVAADVATVAPFPVFLALGLAAAVAVAGAFGWLWKRRAPRRAR